MTREPDEDERRDAIDDRRRRAWHARCQCGDDLPGHCPGPASCPYATEMEGEGEG